MNAKKILLVDDDASVRATLGRVLEAEEYDVLPAESAQKALAQFLRRTPDLVLLDLDMPDGDGWQVFELMEQSHPLVPIIVLTGLPNQMRRATDYGIDALMEKPLDFPMLLTTIRELLAESEPQRVARLTDKGFTTRLLDAHRKNEVAV